jgi:predicted secreted Zn-dependent protease
MRTLVAVVTLTTGAGVASAADDPIRISSLGKGHHRMQPRKVLPPIVKETVEYYEIKGYCEQDLQKQLCTYGVPWKDGKTYDSLTSWDIRWNYGYDREHQSCSADSFTVTIQVTIRYPKWIPADDASPSLVEKWNTYMQSLVEHETGHRDMAVEAAADLSRVVAEIAPAATCADLDRDVRTAARNRMKRLLADNEAYDEATGHGLTQGAVLH